MLPQALLENSSRRSGLICVAGDRYSQIDRTLIELTKSINEQNFDVSPNHGPRKGAMILRQAPQSFQIGSPFLLVQYEEINQPLVLKNLLECQVLIFEKLMDFDELEWALQLAEEGRMVIVHMATNSILSLLHRVYSLWPGGQKEHWHWRFTDSLQLLFNQIFIEKRAVGTDQIETHEASWAYEMALASPLVKKWLKEGNLSSFEVELRQGAEKSGLLSLNQSLLQLLIRRKIDVSTAFASSRDPEDLDSMLKKVGI